MNETIKNAQLSNSKDSVSEKEEMTIISALDNILENTDHKRLAECELEKSSEAFEFIMHKLSISKMQAIIIAMLMDSESCLKTTNMACYLGINNIKFLKYISELNDLVERKIICQHTLRGDSRFSYEICENARKAYINNEVYVTPVHKNLTVAEVIDLISELFNKCDNERINRIELQNEITEITQNNQSIRLCKGLDKMQIYEQIFFYYCVSKFVLDNDTNINPFEISEYTSSMVSHRLSATLEDGKNILIKENFIQNAGNNGFNDKENFTISDEVKNYLVEQLGLTPDDDQEKASKGLRHFNDIVDKHLYYNQKESASMKELTALLTPDNFKGVQQRLNAHGMRTGFACLFYGPPGTGKTESALQLARSTGRDIMEVNIADIKSKWVGDSEKNIKMIFSRYREYCEKCHTLPILLFNEADAIISKRSPNVRNSIDKMENAIQNIILDEMEHLDGILIATTNLTSNMDTAFERRFLYKILFNKPNVDTRIKIWQSMIPELSDSDAGTLAATYDFSGGQIENIARKNLVNSILYDKETSLAQLCTYCDDELLNKKSKSSKIIGFC